MPRFRQAAAVFCLALVLFATLVPTVASGLGGFVFVPLWLVVPAITLAVRRRQTHHADEQPTALFAIVSSRAPPLHFRFI